MCFEAQVAGASGQVLLDSGASDSVVSAAFARLHGVVISEDSGTVTLGDRSVVDRCGKASVYLKLGAFHQSVPCLVLPELLDGVDMICGQDFMMKYRVDLLFTKQYAI